MLDLGGALVARVITRRGPLVIVGGFKAVEAGLVDWELMLVAVFNGRSGSCETVVDSWMAGSFLGRSWSSSSEFIAFLFKLVIAVGRDDTEDEREIADEPTARFSWSACSLGKRDILTFARLRNKNHTLG